MLLPHTKRYVFAVACFALLGLTTVAWSESVEIIVSSEADPLERFAATELERYIEEIFPASVDIVSEPGGKADAVFLLGAATHHPFAAAQLLPALSDQGFLLRNTTWENKPAMLIAGGSPAATLWGVYELVEQYGVQYLLSGDVLPEPQQDFYLPEVNQVFEPAFRARWLKTMGDFAMGTEGWGMADYRPLLDQLAKLKFNRIRVGSGPSQPFLNLRIDGVQRESATLWYGERFPITEDMPGRKLFGQEKEFWNPDLPFQEAGYDALTAAGQRHLHELVAYANSRGIEASSVWSITDFSKDFAPVVPGAEAVQQLGALTVTPGPDVRPDNAELTAFASTVVRKIIDEFPEMQAYGFPVGTEWPGWVAQYEWAWKELDKRYGIEGVISLEEVLRRARARADYPGGPDRAVAEVKGHITGLYFLLQLWNTPGLLSESKRPDARLVIYEVAEEFFPILPRVLPPNSELVLVIDYNATRVLARREVLEHIPGKEVPTSMVLSLHDDSVGLIPMLTTHSLHEIVGEMRKTGVSGMATRQWMLGDHDLSMAYLSKAAWYPDATPNSVYVNQIRSVCGEAAVEPMLEAFRELEATTIDLEAHGMGLAFPWPGMVMISHWHERPFEKLKPEDLAGYRRALAAVRRTPTPSRSEGKAYLRYWEGRLGFGVGYLEALFAVKEGAIAEKAARDALAAGDKPGYRKHLDDSLQHAESALNTMVSAINTFADVARDRADAGAVATMGEFVYRPLKKKVEELRAELARTTEPVK
jgi:hypothetical protein